MGSHVNACTRRGAGWQFPFLVRGLLDWNQVFAGVANPREWKAPREEGSVQAAGSHRNAPCERLSCSSAKNHNHLKPTFFIVLISFFFFAIFGEHFALFFIDVCSLDVTKYPP